MSVGRNIFLEEISWFRNPTNMKFNEDVENIFYPNNTLYKQKFLYAHKL
jgi:hypothetical protein